nr:proline--tRNA ligase [Patescibacteria group bacterium]
PKLAPIQVIILPVKAEEAINAACQSIADRLNEAGYRVKVDTDDERIGWKSNKWELRGVPIRVEIGNKELEEGVFTLARRDTDEKERVRIEDAPQKIAQILEEIQANLLSQAETFLQTGTHDITNWEAFKQQMDGEKGFLKAFWCGKAACEAQIKEESRATTRCLAEEGVEGVCIHCGEQAKQKWYFAQSY